MRTSLVCAAIGALLQLPATAQDAERESLQVIGTRALHAVEEHLGYELERELTFRESDSRKVEKILRRELLPQFEIQFEDADEAKAQCRQFSKTMAAGLLAKYEFGTGNVMVLPETITELASLIDEPKLDAPETLQAILVHECVHVLADQRYEFTKRVNQLANTDAILAYNAVIEGHAQFVARQVCKQHGWSEGFEVFTKSIGKVPDLGDEGLNVLARMQAVSLSWAYYDGEKFMAAMHAENGEDGIKRAYLEPPATPTLVFHPDWYLDPSKQPKIEFAIEEAFDEFAERFEDADWMKMKQTINRAQLEQALGLLGKEAVARITKHVQTCRSSVAQTRNPPGEKMIAAAVFVCDSVAESAYVLASEERLMRLKDEQMKSGSIKILDATYTPQRRGPIHGLHAFKTVKFRGQEVPITTVVLTNGRVVLELTYSNKEIELKTAVDAAELLLTRMMTTHAADDGDSNDGDSDDGGK